VHTGGTLRRRRRQHEPVHNCRTAAVRRRYQNIVPFLVWVLAAAIVLLMRRDDEVAGRATSSKRY
jgi:hypothetical protein